MGWKMYFLLGMPIFRGYGNFRECRYSQLCTLLFIYIIYIYLYIYTFAEEWCEVTNRFGWTSIIVPLMVQFGKWLNFNHYHLPVPKNSCNAKSLLKSIINTVQCHWFYMFESCFCCWTWKSQVLTETVFFQWDPWPSITWRNKGITWALTIQDVFRWYNMM